MPDLMDLWTRAVAEMEGCPIPTEACQAIGCDWGDPCLFDLAIKAAVAVPADTRKDP